MIYIGIDYGDARTGVAVSYDGIASLPLCVVDSTGGRKKTASEIARIISERSAGTVVIGLPLNMDGSSGKRVAATEKFAKALKTALEGSSLDPEIAFFDERLTSRSAASEMALMGRQAGKDGIVDQISAAIILDAYIASQRNKGDKNE